MAKKKAVHKKQAVNHTVKSKKSNKTVILSAIIAILVIAAGAYYFLTKDSVMATVNGEPIYESEVTEQLNGLKTQYGAQITIDVALNQTIIEKILMQEAKKQGIMVDDAKLDSFIDDSLASSGQTRESFEATLKTQNLTLAKIRERIRTQLAITELVNKTIPVSEVTDKEAKEFFDTNKQLFQGQAYTAVKTQIVDYLTSQKQVKEFQAYVANLRATADVKIN